MNGLKLGLGLRPTHFPYLESKKPVRVDWFEATSENYMNTEGRPLEILLKLRERFPIALHGVSMSLASAKGVTINYLKDLKSLIDKVEPFIVSDHLCWSQTPANSLHDLLPFPYTKSNLKVISRNIQNVQDYLKRELLIENISSYMSFKEDEMTEFEFMKCLCEQTGCKVLLDINNIYVNSVNHGFKASECLKQVPSHFIGQIHLAGPSQMDGFLFDTHSTKVPESVWGLVNEIKDRILDKPIMLEWDENIPDFQTCENEIFKIKKILKE